MKVHRLAILFVALIAVSVHARTHWVLVWHDEFEGRKNSPPDHSKWGYDVGGGGWGNHELETYTSLIDNVFQDGNGHLVIQALHPDVELTLPAG